MEALLKGGADIDKAQREGETPLMAAARAGSVPAVKLLLAHGANPNTAESLWDETALMWATAEGHLDVVDALLAAGADPNLKARASELTKRSTRTDFPSGGFTAVMWAARDGDEPLVRRLVAGGADIKLANADGATPMMLAIINDRFDLAAKLLPRRRRERRLVVSGRRNARRDHRLASEGRHAAAREPPEPAHGDYK